MTKSLKIIHFCPLPLFSGLEQYALLLATEQKRLGHEISFVVQKDSVLEKEVAKAGIETIVVDVYGAKNTFSGGRQYHGMLRHRTDIDVIHLHTSHDIERIGVALQLLRFVPDWKRPKIVQQNHIWISHSKRDPIHWLTYRVLDEVWCSSTMAKRDLERFLPVPSEKIHIVRYGRDLKIRDSFLTREAARRELGLTGDVPVVGAIARIDRAKGIWELLNGAVEAMKSGLDFTLVVIGGPTMSDPAAIAFSRKVEEFVESLPPEIGKRIRMTGGIPEAGRLLKAFDVYAQASYKETFSLALLDAQLAELPVIGTSSGGTPEVVREGHTGWLGEPESVEAMSTVFRRALAQGDQWKSFGATARARVEEDFDLNKVLDSIITRYQATRG